MPIINYKTREINCKIVYAGPSLSGKTTNIKGVHGIVPGEYRSALQCINTEGDRTLFFDYFSLDLTDIKGLKAKFLIYGVPGQPYYKSTRKMVLNGVDGLVYVADSDRLRLEENINDLRELKEMIGGYDYDYLSIPMVFQYNKRDLEDICSVEELEQALNDREGQYFEAIAIRNMGVIETFKAICSEVVRKLNADLGALGKAGKY